MVATGEPAFVKHLREIAEGKRPKPTTRARDQHYVPSFLLARWATPPKREGKLALLTVPSGQTATAKPGEVAWQRDLYAMDADTGSLDLVIEAFLSIIENYAADPIKRLAGLPQAISDEDRWTIAFFLALQQGRTPPGLADHRRLAEEAVRQFLRSRRARLSDFGAVTAAYRRNINPTAGDAEIEAFADAQRQALPDENGPLALRREAQFQSLFANVSRIALTVAAMDWTLLVGEAEFVASDRGLAMWDPKLPRTRGNMWHSSPVAETTVPVAPSVCLKLTPGASGFAVETADDAQVMAMNLRTYGWADKGIFGTGVQVVRDVHRAACSDPGAVPRPVAPRINRCRIAPGAQST